MRFWMLLYVGGCVAMESGEGPTQTHTGTTTWSTGSMTGTLDISQYRWSSFDSFDAASFTLCGVSLEGELECWMEDLLPHVELPQGGDVAQVALGNHTGCVLRASGEVECWMEAGALEDLTDEPEGPFEQVVVGGIFPYACARRATGEVVCWGSNPPNPTYDDYVQIDVSGRYVGTTANFCGVREKGELDCTGDIGPEGVWDEVVLEDSKGCARAGTDVTCWDQYEGLEPDSPTAVVRAAGLVVCALDEEGAAACQGTSPYGLVEPPPGESFTDMTMTNKQGCVLKPSGEPVCWGLGWW